LVDTLKEGCGVLLLFVPLCVVILDVIAEVSILFEFGGLGKGEHFKSLVGGTRVGELAEVEELVDRLELLFVAGNACIHLLVHASHLSV